MRAACYYRCGFMEVDHEVGFRGGAPDGFMHLFCLALGLALATLNNLFMSQWRMISACFFRFQQA
eukprot:4879515-Amphidinium_carterae.1